MSDEQDAKRYRWLKQYLKIASDGPGEWTCWLALDCIPIRVKPSEHDAEKLLDKMIARWPTVEP